MSHWSLSLELYRLDRPNIKILGFSRGESDPSAKTLYPHINRVLVHYLNKRSKLNILQEVLLEVTTWVLLRSKNYHFSSSHLEYNSSLTSSKELTWYRNTGYVFSKRCRNWTSLGGVFVFRIDMCSVHTA